MLVFIVVTKYYEDGFLGVFSSITKAREGIMQVFEEDDNITAFEDCGDYTYLFITKNGERNFFSIISDVIDSAIV